MTGEPNHDNIQARPASRIARHLTRLVLMIAVPAVLVLGGITYYYAGGRFVTSENAYVKAPIVSVVSQVSGRVNNVHVRENQLVRRGQKLLELERDEFELAVAEAQANLAAVVQDINNLRAELRRANAEIEVVEERRRFLASEFKRRQKLADKGVGLGTKLDEARHLMRAADRNMAAARERKAGILASLNGDPNIPAEVHPKHIAASARLERAQLALDRSLLIAPADGVVVKMNLEAGEYIKSGESVFAIVQVGKAWIEVNLKETELTHVRRGQKATFVAEAYPDVRWQAEVTGISPATGAEFAVLPPQNASGNWVKVVQRLPVRLSITPDHLADKPPLRSGMTVAVSIDTGHKRKAPPIISQVLAATRTFVRPAQAQ